MKSMKYDICLSKKTTVLPATMASLDVKKEEKKRGKESFLAGITNAFLVLEFYLGN